MANYYFTIGDGIQDGSLNDDGNPYLLPAYQEAYDATFTGAANGQYDRIFLDITIPFDADADGNGASNARDYETWLYVDTPGYNGVQRNDGRYNDPNNAVQDVFILRGLPTGWTYGFTNTQFGSIAANGEFYSAAEWDGLNFQYLQIYDENGAQQTGIAQIYLLSANGNFICFDKSTKIERADGSLVKIEDLRVGDSIATKMNGDQKISWIDKSVVTLETLKQFPKMKPVRIKRGALGNDQDLIVSAQHAIFLDHEFAMQRLGLEIESLVPAKALVNGNDVVIDEPTEPVVYYHMLFDEHQVVKSNGIWSESYRPGKWSLSILDERKRAELFFLFPELETKPWDESKAALKILKPGQINQLQKRQKRKLQEICSELRVR